MNTYKLDKLKRRAERAAGCALDWHDERWYNGSAWADLEGGGYVSVMVDPPEGTPQIGGTIGDIECKTAAQIAAETAKSLSQLSLSLLT